jgi:hypothetical protein
MQYNEIISVFPPQTWNMEILNSLNAETGYSTYVIMGFDVGALILINGSRKI